jgi:hypothetical protein
MPKISVLKKRVERYTRLTEERESDAFSAWGRAGHFKKIGKHKESDKLKAQGSYYWTLAKRHEKTLFRSYQALEREEKRKRVLRTYEDPSIPHIIEFARYCEWKLKWVTYSYTRRGIKITFEFPERGFGWTPEFFADLLWEYSKRDAFSENRILLTVSYESQTNDGDVSIGLATLAHGGPYTYVLRECHHRLMRWIQIMSMTPYQNILITGMYYTVWYEGKAIERDVIYHRQ